MTPARSTPELLTLQALRLAGCADQEAIADRALLRHDTLRAHLDEAERAGFVEPLSFAETRGWILSDTGQAHLAALLERDLEDAAARQVLAATLTEFERTGGINARFVQTVSQWQLRSTATVQFSAPEGTEDLETLLAELTVLGEQLRAVLAALIDRMPRFGRYPAQYDSALRRARTEGLGGVTGVGNLSCHTVWAELHQDLRSTAGQGRAATAGGER